jgi:hypothetical protein
MAARDRLARRATRSRTAVTWQGRPRRDLRRGKAEASASPAVGGAMQNVDVQGGDAATELVYRKVACGAGGAAARRFGVDPPRGQ